MATTLKGPGSVASWLPTGKDGVYEISHKVATERDAAWSNMRAAAGHPWERIRAGTYTRLTKGGDWGTLMSDTDMEWQTNGAPLYRSKGAVLMAGLGIGFIVKEVVERPQVTSVVVVEKSPEVVRLVEPAMRAVLGPLASKLAIVVADIKEYKPARGYRFDCIYVDIWGDQSPDEIAEGQKICARLRRYQSKGGWTSFWRIR